MYTYEQLEDLRYSEEYAEWLMENGLDYDVIICNGDSLLAAQERGVGFDAFLRSIGG